MHRLSIAALFLFVILTTASAQQIICPKTPGWRNSTMIPNKCFFIGDVTKSETWYSAEMACRALAVGPTVGNLVSIKNLFESSIIKAMVQDYITIELGQPFPGPYWIGGYDYQTPGTYQWTDGSPFDYPTTDPSPWYPGEPNPSGDCVEAELGTANDQWFSGSCGDSNSYVCQLVPKNATCKPGWTFIDETNKCYSVFKKELSWDDAENACKMQTPGVPPASGGGHLAEIPSLAVNNALVKLTADPAVPRCVDPKGWFWIGLKLTVTNMPVWDFTWSTNLAITTPFDDAPGKYANFTARGPPTALPPALQADERCTQFAAATCRAYADNSAVLRGQWAAIGCNEALPMGPNGPFQPSAFICEMPAPSTRMLPPLLPPPPPAKLH